MSVCAGEGTVHERPIKDTTLGRNRHYPTPARNKGNLPPKLLKSWTPAPALGPIKDLKRG